MAGLGRTLTAALVALVAGAAAVALSTSSAGALDANDSITLSGTESTNGLYAGYPFSLTGSYNDADDNAAGANVIFVLKASDPSLTSCPDNYQATEQQVEMASGQGQGNTYDFQVMATPADASAQAGTFAAKLNTPFDPTEDSPTPQNITRAGTYLACAFMLDSSANTLAVSNLFTFVVHSPKSSTTAAKAFGGPAKGPNDGHPADLTLSVKPAHTLKAPGTNVIHVSGRIATNASGVGPAVLTMTVKPTKTFNGCAGTSSQDMQLADSGGGGTLAYDEQLNQSSTGKVSGDVAFKLKKKVKESGVLCAYVLNSTAGTDLEVGYYRFTLPVRR